MSCRIASNDTIALIASSICAIYHNQTDKELSLYLKNPDLCESLSNMWTKAGDMSAYTTLYTNLKIMNHEAFGQRYPKSHVLDEIDKKYIPSEQESILNDVQKLESGEYHIPPECFQLLKSLNFYIYQCSEGNIDKKNLYKGIESFKQGLEAFLIHNQKPYINSSLNKHNKIY